MNIKAIINLSIILFVQVNAAPKGAGSGPPGTKYESDCYWVMRSLEAMGKTTSVISSDSTSCCSIPGVSCSGSTVIRLIWRSKGLTGPIPEEIGNLKSLKRM